MPERLKIPGPGGGEIGAFFTAPDSGASPGLIILHEIFGVTEFIRNRVDFFAGQGFASMAIDLYWRVAPGADFGYEGQGWDDAFATRNKLDDDQSVGDVGHCVEALRVRPECSGDVFVLGYCLGGLYAYLAASRLDIRGSISFHGVRLETRLEVADAVSKPLQLHFCGLDKWVTQPAVAEVKAALKGNNGVEIFDYPNSDHGFTRIGMDVYNEADANTAHDRVLEFSSRAATR